MTCKYDKYTDHILCSTAHNLVCNIYTETLQTKSTESAKTTTTSIEIHVESTTHRRRATSVRVHMEIARCRAQPQKCPNRTRPQVHF